MMQAFDPLSAAIVGGGTLVATLLRCGWRDARAAVAKHAPEVLRIGVAKLLAHDAAARVIAGRGRVFGGVGRAVHGTRRAIRRSGGRRRVGASSIMLDMHHGDVRCWVTRSDEAGPNTMPAPRQGP